MAEALRVCIFLEGSYPFITGGVSSWVHDLIKNLPDVEFSLYTISPQPDQKSKYPLLPNVREHKDVVINRLPPEAKKSDLSFPKEVMEKIYSFHQAGPLRSADHLRQLISRLPEGEFLHRHSFASKEGWDLLVRKNQEKNPLYPFSDYFWAFRSSHEMIFTVLSNPPPEAHIYHAVSTGFAGLAALAAKIRHGKPLLLTEHGLYHKEREMEIRAVEFVQGYQRDMWIQIYNSLARMCYQEADVVTALFEVNRQKQIELGARKDNTFVIPNGIDIPRFSSVTRKSRPGFHIGLVGRVVPIKDIKTFIVCAKIVCDRLPEARFYVIGPTEEDPGYFRDCAALVESLRISDRFIFTGSADVLEYYSFLDVMLLTSVREAQPLVILEAYAAGIPVVSTAVGNVPELMDFDERFLASPKDAEKLASGIFWLHDHPEEREELIKKNSRVVRSFYDKKDLHRKFSSLYLALREGRLWQE